MTPEQAVEYAGGKPSQLAALLNVKPPVVHNWLARRRIPAAYQIELNAISEGILKLDRIKRIINGRRRQKA